MKRQTILAAIAALALASAASAAEYSFDCPGIAGFQPAIPAALTLGDTINLTLDGGEAFSLKLVSAPPAGIAGQSFIARDAARGAGATVRPSKAGDALRIAIDDFENAKAYTIRIKGGKASVTVRDSTATLPDECGTCQGETPASESGGAGGLSPVVRAAAAPLLASSDSNAFTVETHNPVIDILVVFDQGAKEWALANDYDSIEDCAAVAIDRMNDVLVHSQLSDKFAYRLVGAMEIDATYNTVTEPLEPLRNAKGAFARVPAMQAATGADTTVLLVDRDAKVSGTSGLSYALTGEGITDAKALNFGKGNNAYSACDIKTSFARYTMSHEVGHQMGCGHSNLNETNGYADHQSEIYSLGYHFFAADGTPCHTVMAYNYATFTNGVRYSTDTIPTIKSIPYFSSPDITPEDLGVPVGTPTNDNRRVLLQTYTSASQWRERTIPYDWELSFKDSSGNVLPDFVFADISSLTITHPNPNATIYYTTDGSTPNATSTVYNGRVTLWNEIETITASAVTNGVAISTRKITVVYGRTWSGESGQNGNGRWSSDSSVSAWNNCSAPFSYGANVLFPDLADTIAATVTVNGAVTPGSTFFKAASTAYTFNAGGDDALITLSEDAISIPGNVTFNVPVKTSATAYTVPARKTHTFNAPFGETATAEAGSCTIPIAVGDAATLRIAPGKGKTQTFAKFNTRKDSYWNTATLVIGEGTVRFTGARDGNSGLFGSLKLAVEEGGNLIFDQVAPTGIDVNNSSLTIERGGTVTYNDSEYLRRTLNLNGGRLVLAGTNSGRSIDFLNGPTINVTADSCLDATYATPNAFLRGTPSFVLSNGATLTNNILYVDGTERNKEATGGISVSGNGTFQQNSYGGATLTYLGATTVGTGVTFEMNATHQNPGAYSVAQGARLTGTGAITGAGVVSLAGGAVLDGSLAVANLSCADGAKFGDATHPVAATVTGSLATATDGAAVTVTNGCLIVGADCDATAFATANLTIHGAGLVLSNDLTVATLLCKNSTITLADGKSLTITGTRGIDFPDLLTLKLVDLPEADRIHLLSVAARFAGQTWKNITVEGLPYGYELACDGTNLYCRKITDTYTIPGLGVSIAYDATLDAWLAADETYQQYCEWDYWYEWQDYLAEPGANRYANWLNFVLGLSAEDEDSKVKATIEIVDGNVVVSVADSIPDAPTIPPVKVKCTLFSATKLGDWDTGAEMDGKSATIALPDNDEPPSSGFYRIDVTIEPR